MRAQTNAHLDLVQKERERSEQEECLKGKPQHIQYAHELDSCQYTIVPEVFYNE